MIVKPPLNISTGSIFAKLNLSRIRQRPDTNGMIEALDSGDLNGLSKRMFNVLETVTAAEFGIINVLKSELLDTNALGAVMSGSGSAVFGLYESEYSAREAYDHLKRKYSEVFLCKPHVL
ncbi:4-diphosphocytidyl-2-C-methyl-D-erythritol kinase [bioreactor metagenome]|uniref:4-diphosphocytidyl-2-C-methyl-D-erythritol kinase n=1 Tax=bioreactor metagenome TaxID=1076179 RepID=A0A645GII0_9ZZZZ